MVSDVSLGNKVRLTVAEETFQDLNGGTNQRLGAVVGLLVQEGCARDNGTGPRNGHPENDYIGAMWSIQVSSVRHRGG